MLVAYTANVQSPQVLSAVNGECACVSPGPYDRAGRERTFADPSQGQLPAWRPDRGPRNWKLQRCDHRSQRHCQGKVCADTLRSGDS
jgi:hypothetical protein